MDNVVANGYLMRSVMLNVMANGEKLAIDDHGWFFNDGQQRLVPS